MNVDLRTGHLGDLLLLAPALRAGDTVHGLPEQYQLHQLPVTYDPRPCAGAWDLGHHHYGEHRTEGWLRLSGRKPVRHRLLPADPPLRSDVLVAPDSGHPARAWPHFQCLTARLRADPPGYVTFVSHLLPRAQWLVELASAQTVICPNTGTAHMADALGVPRVIALYESEDSFRTCAPYWNRGHCLVAPPQGLAYLTVEHVMERLQ